ncbi:transporter, solute:sodium symporter (SSS) family protein [Aspergillus tubingensis]|uniref:transporter, solute:sodium symporter (SSS) family protein n=1 Tax=Aspergillus tubingensis TaxID=5068 RepID=UPI001578F0EC|nr:transporter, solute:sodium symporter (SSS) family protein [Aspergillus tubingensis]GFN10650.1 transporter, solute:sodium symporter (SSS) family protein [Aspergillus tubingensis]
MAATLPLELLQLIGDSLQKEGVPLFPCTTVCRWWKEAFEPFIYSRVVVCSTHANEKAPVSGIPIDVFEDITSHAGAARRMMIRAIEYRIYAEIIYDIVKHSPYITELRMNLGYLQRPEELEYLRARRLGNWLTLPTEEAEARIATVQQWEQGHDHSDDSHLSQPVIEIENFQRFFISMGLAVQHMPRLSSDYFHPGAETELTFGFQVITGRVASAWGFSEEDLRHAALGEMVYSVRFMTHMV